jgi:hypothetical protein
MRIVDAFPGRGLLAVVVMAAACNNAGSDLGVEVTARSAVTVLVYLDRDGSRTPTEVIDTVFRNARVGLLPLTGSDTLEAQFTTTQGLARFDAVPLGTYRIGVTQASVGDSVEVQAIDPDTLQIVASDTNRGVLVRLGYPEVSIREARSAPLGRRVFVRGFILAGVQSFRDTTSHLADSSGQIRLTRVSLRGSITGNSPGDSVSVLGLTSTRSGQPTLDNAIISRFGARPAPIPLPVATITAVTANNGVLDAGLVLITGALISDTSTVAPDFRVVASDGTGDLTIILDGNIPFARANFRPGRSMNIRGVLVPDGAGSWQLKPRDTGDVGFNN